MLRLYVTRHGETVWNTQQRLQGWKDSPLTEKGVHHAKLLGKRLQDIEFQAVYSSSSERTIATAEYIMGKREQPIIPDDNLREIHMGRWEGKTADELGEKEAEAYHAFFHMPHRYVAESGENYDVLQNRVLQALQRIMSEHDSGDILVVTHTVVIKMLLKYANNLPLEELWGEPYIHDTSLTVLEIRDGQIEVAMAGDISHRE
ncbi:MAG: histidine phosphatase family protein [Bacillus sp. (in: firmicutes)]